jgi:hypothetical protein
VGGEGGAGRALWCAGGAALLHPLRPDGIRAAPLLCFIVCSTVRAVGCASGGPSWLAAGGWWLPLSGRGGRRSPEPHHIHSFPCSLWRRTRQESASQCWCVALVSARGAARCGSTGRCSRLVHGASWQPWGTRVRRAWRHGCGVPSRPCASKSNADVVSRQQFYAHAVRADGVDGVAALVTWACRVHQWPDRRGILIHMGPD